MPETIRNNPALSRYELDADGYTGVAYYRLADGVMTLNHTEVPPEAQGRGIASRLVHAVLEEARRLGYRVVPRCPFVGQFIARHPEFADLIL
jgi:predicted GNAT family acetyltransferase